MEEIITCDHCDHPMRAEGVNYDNGLTELICDNCNYRTEM